MLYWPQTGKLHWLVTDAVMQSQTPFLFLLSGKDFYFHGSFDYQKKSGWKGNVWTQAEGVAGGKKIDLYLLGRQESNGGITCCTLLSMTLMQKIVMKDWPKLENHFPLIVTTALQKTSELWADSLRCCESSCFSPQCFLMLEHSDSTQKLHCQAQLFKYLY